MKLVNVVDIHNNIITCTIKAEYNNPLTSEEEQEIETLHDYVRKLKFADIDFSADIDMSNRLSGGIGRVQNQVQKDLLGRTFVLVNEIHVIDHSNRGKTWGLITGLAMTALAVATSSDGKISQSTQDDIAATANLISSWKKCALKVRTQLYQLVWDFGGEHGTRTHNTLIT